MTAIKPHILIVNFTFPPYAGVGGRRWAKFAKYLKKQEIPFHVIASQRLETASNWTKDIETYKDSVSYIPGSYPLILTSNPQTVWAKIKYRLALMREKYLAQGNYYDISKYWEKELIPLMRKKIVEGTNVIIYSIPPFRGAYFISKLKNDFPNVQFIADFRDPWTSNRTSFGFESLSEKNLRHEIEMEREVIHSFDKVMSVSKEINDYLIHTHKAPADKFHVLKNGFDVDDKGSPNNTTDKISFAFIGTFYQKAKHLFDEFTQAISDLETEHPEWFEKVAFNFYGHKPDYFNAGIENTSSIHHHGLISLEEASQQIANARACMLFLADDTNYSFSTKFYEYVSNKKPVLLFAKSGITSEFITENSIGISLAPGEIKEQLKKVILQAISNDLIFNTNFDTKPFEVNQLTKNLLKIISYES